MKLYQTFIPVCITFLILSGCEIENNPVELLSLVASDSIARSGDVVVLACEAQDGDGDKLSYDWETTPLRRGLPTGSTKINVINHISRTPAYSGSVSQSISGSWDDYWDSGSTDLTGSYLVPYVTTIGLYNNDNEMLAVAKLPKPIKNLP